MSQLTPRCFDTLLAVRFHTEANEKRFEAGEVDGFGSGAPNTRVELAIRDALLAIALCHNVSPIEAEDGDSAFQVW